MGSIIQGFDELRDSNGNLLGPLGFGFQADWEVIERIQVTAAQATVDLDLGATGFDPDLYSEYELTIHDLTQVSDASLLLRTSTDGGATYDAGVSDYSWFVRRVTFAVTPVEANVGDDADASLRISNNLGNVAGEVVDFVIRIGDLSAASSMKKMHWSGVGRLLDGVEESVRGAGARLDSTAVNGIRVVMGTGDIDGGVFTLRGRRKTPVSLISQDDWVVITDEETVAAAATHDYFWDDNVYDEIEITLTGALTGTDDRNLEARLSSDGSTFHSGATDYKVAFANDNDAGTGGGLAPESTTGSTEIIIVSSMGTTADELFDTIIRLTGVSNSLRKQKGTAKSNGIAFNAVFQNQRSNFIDMNTDDRCQGIQLRGESAATMAFDRVRIRGRRKTPLGVLKQDWEVLDTWDHDDTGDIAEIEWTDIPSTEFDEFELTMKDMTTGTTGNTIAFQFSDDNGATWDSTAANYQYDHHNRSPETAFTEIINNGGLGHIAISANFGSAVGRNHNGIIHIGPLDGPADRGIRYICQAVNDSDNMRNQAGAGRWEAHTGVTTAFRFDLVAGGNFTGGRIVLRGRRKIPV